MQFNHEDLHQVLRGKIDELWELWIFFIKSRRIRENPMGNKKINQNEQLNIRKKTRSHLFQHLSGQILICQQSRFPWNKKMSHRFPETKTLPKGPQTRVSVARIWHKSSGLPLEIDFALEPGVCPDIPRNGRDASMENYPERCQKHLGWYHRFYRSVGCICQYSKYTAQFTIGKHPLF